ncbi:hypothetical protein H5410_021369, partial [Solanum commersonii]
KSAYTAVYDKLKPELDLGIIKVKKMGWFHIMVHDGRPWEDEHVDVIMYYLRKKAKHSTNIRTRYLTTDSVFMSWLLGDEILWEESNCDMSSISPNHCVGQYMRGYNLIANIPWDRVDNIIPVNVSECFHWILVVFRIKHRCLYIYVSKMGDENHTEMVKQAVESIARMIPLFFSSIGYYGKRSDIQWHMEPAYFDKSEMEPLEYKLQRNIPQQHPYSNFKIFNVFSDSGLYACVFAELTHGVFEIPSQCFMPKLHRKRYGALLWAYATSKLSEGAISEGEVSGKFASKLGEPSINRDIVRDCQKIQMPFLRPRVYK